MGVQESPDLSDDLLVGPAGGDLLRTLLTDGSNVPQACWRALGHVQDIRPEGYNEPTRIDRADAVDHTGAEIPLDAGKTIGRHNFDEHGAELQAVLTIDDPVARSRRVLAPRDSRRVFDQRDKVALAPDLQAQRTETAIAVAIAKGYAIDQPGQLVQFGPGAGSVVQVARKGAWFGVVLGRRFSAGQRRCNFLA